MASKYNQLDRQLHQDLPNLQVTLFKLIDNDE